MNNNLIVGEVDIKDLKEVDFKATTSEFPFELKWTSKKKKREKELHVKMDWDNIAKRNHLINSIRFANQTL